MACGADCSSALGERPGVAHQCQRPRPSAREVTVGGSVNVIATPRWQLFADRRRASSAAMAASAFRGVNTARSRTKSTLPLGSLVDLLAIDAFISSKVTA
jgi:hypothetical protein